MNQVVKIPKGKNEKLIPWSELGTSVAPKEGIDSILYKANLEWQAKRSPVLYADDGEIVQGTSDAIYRSDTRFQLGIVTGKYNIVQPKEVISFYQDLAKLKGWKLDAVGHMDSGKRLWALAKTDTSFFAGDNTDDIIDIHLLLTTTFDGTSSTIGKFVGIREASGNSLSLAVGKNRGLGKVKVHHKSTFNPKQLKEKLGVYKKASEVFEEQITQLVNTKVSDDKAMRFLVDMLESEGFDPTKLSARNENIILSVFDMYKGNGIGSNWSNSSGTAWGLLSALTEHVDYNVGRNENNRIRSAWFGLGETLKIKAMTRLLDL